MSTWRVIETDTERFTGVAPVCDNPDQHVAVADAQAGDLHDVAGPLVYDCCPQPHIEVWNAKLAEKVAQLLTAANAEVCS